MKKVSFLLTTLFAVALSQSAMAQFDWTATATTVLGCDNAQFAGTFGGGCRNTVLGANSNGGGGSDNTITGQGAMGGGGQRNTAMGSFCMVAGGDDNISIGYQANGGGGNDNVVIGNVANSGGPENVVVGRSAMGGGPQSVTIGMNSMGGPEDVIIGHSAMGGHPEGVAIGRNASLGGPQEVVIGKNAAGMHPETVVVGFNSTVNGPQSIAIGANSVGTGPMSVVIGNFAGSGSGAAQNTFIGGTAGNGSSGSDNTFVGANAGVGVSGSGNVGIGSNTNSSAFNNTVSIGNNAQAGQNDAIVLGDPGNPNIKVGIGTNTPATQLHATSDVRFSGLPTAVVTPSVVGQDAAGNLYTIPYPPGGGLGTTCGTVGRLLRVSGPLMTNCSIFEDNGLNGAVGGAPVAGFTLTVYGGFQVLSDRKFKENITTVSNALDKVRQLNGVYYNWKSQQYPNMNLSAERQLGFISQEVRKVLPELTSVNEEGTVLMNYLGLIPVLNEAIKELDVKNAQLESQITQLTATVQELKNQMGKISGNGANLSTGAVTRANSYMLQNVPNPFTGTTEVSYSFSGTFQSASLIVFDMNGAQILKHNLAENTGKVVISADQLRSGMYLYSLVVDGNEIATKKMVVTK